MRFISMARGEVRAMQALGVEMLNVECRDPPTKARTFASPTRPGLTAAAFLCLKPPASPLAAKKKPGPGRPHNRDATSAHRKARTGKRGQPGGPDPRGAGRSVHWGMPTLLPKNALGDDWFQGENALSGSRRSGDSSPILRTEFLT